MPSPSASLERRAGPGKQEGALARMSSLLRGGGLKTGGRPPSPIIEMVTLITMMQTCARCLTMLSPRCPPSPPPRPPTASPRARRGPGLSQSTPRGRCCTQVRRMIALVSIYMIRLYHSIYVMIVSIFMNHNATSVRCPTSGPSPGHTVWYRLPHLQTRLVATHLSIYISAYLHLYKSKYLHIYTIISAQTRSLCTATLAACPGPCTRGCRAMATSPC